MGDPRPLHYILSLDSHLCSGSAVVEGTSETMSHELFFQVKKVQLNHNETELQTEESLWGKGDTKRE